MDIEPEPPTADQQIRMTAALVAASMKPGSPASLSRWTKRVEEYIRTGKDIW